MFKRFIKKLLVKSGFIERVGVRGVLVAELFGPDGKRKAYRKVKNIVTTVGLAHIADQLSASPGEAVMSHMSVGTGTDAAAAGDTKLKTELDRNALTSRTDAAAVVSYVGTWSAGDATGALTEAGIFNSAVTDGGTLLCHQVFSVINKGALDSLVITWTLTFADDGV